MKWIDLLNTNIRNCDIRRLMKKYSSMDLLLSNFSKLSDDMKREIENCKSYNIDEDVRVISYFDDEYPEYLRNLKDFPTFLFLRGKRLDDSLKVAVVGTRKNTKLGELTCKKIIKGLSDYDITIVSGMARGIDSIAHKSAIEYGMNTIAILPTDIFSCYPIENMKLKEYISCNGTVVSEFKPNTKLTKANFVIRNRLIAGLSRLVYIPESYISGGSLITAKFANMYNKEIYTSPADIFNKSFEGCNELIAKNIAKLVRSSDDIAYEYGWRKKSEKISSNS